MIRICDLKLQLTGNTVFFHRKCNAILIHHSELSSNTIYSFTARIGCSAGICRCISPTGINTITIFSLTVNTSSPFHKIIRVISLRNILFENIKTAAMFKSLAPCLTIFSLHYLRYCCSYRSVAVIQTDVILNRTRTMLQSKRCGNLITGSNNKITHCHITESDPAIFILYKCCTSLTITILMINQCVIIDRTTMITSLLFSHSDNVFLNNKRFVCHNKLSFLDVTIKIVEKNNSRI